MPSAATTPRSPRIISSRPTMIDAIHGEARSTATSATSTPRHEQLVRRRVEERAELRRELPAAREVAVDEVGRGRDAEQDRRPGRGGARIAAVDHQQRHHDGREDDPQGRAGRQEASRPDAAHQAHRGDAHEAAGCYRPPVSPSAGPTRSVTPFASSQSSARAGDRPGIRECERAQRRLDLGDPAGRHAQLGDARGPRAAPPRPDRRPARRTRRPSGRAPPRRP